MLKDKLVPIEENSAATNMRKLASRLRKSHESWAVWGMGATGQRAMSYLQELSCGVPQYIVDNNPALWGKNGVISPGHFFALDKQPDILLVCVYVADQVIEQVKGEYQGEIIIFSTLALLDLRERWKFYEDNMVAVEEVYGMLTDDLSRKTIEGFLNSIRSGDVSYLEAISGDSHTKVLDPSILQFTEQEVFADIGAFTGDTITDFLRLTNGKYKKIIGFELDSQNYEVLQRTVSKMQRVSIRNIAVGSATQTALYTSGRSESCILSDAGDASIEVVALDDVPEMWEATFIKISVNSMEFPVLQGAEKLLSHNTPKLAVYTSGDLLWKIPRYLKTIAPQYTLYFRHYGYGVQAMACYAVNRELLPS